MQSPEPDERAQDVVTDAADRRPRRRRLKWVVRGLLVAVLACLVLLWGLIVLMPGESYRGALPPLSDAQAALCEELRADVERLAGDIGERNIAHPESYRQAAEFIEASLAKAGYTVERQSYRVADQACCNLAVEVEGGELAGEILVVGAHYDTVFGCPGANDNGSAVAALLALARRFSGCQPARTLRFVAFANEEPPHFQTDHMGSLVYAKHCRARGEEIVGMISLETMGYYSDAKGSQNYPPPFSLLYPSTGDFVAFVGNLRSRRFVRQVVGTFRQQAQFPSEGAAIPGIIREAGWSDHWAFWEQGYPALMVTDTAPFRYPYYHLPEDTPDKLDYTRLARVVDGLRATIAELAGCQHTEPR